VSKSALIMIKNDLHSLPFLFLVTLSHSTSLSLSFSSMSAQIHKVGAVSCSSR